MTNGGSAGGYALFRQRQFRELWSANLVLNLGQVMLLLAAAWIMTSLTQNAVLVSLVQATTSLPFLLLGVPVGIISDRVGHRGLLVAAQLWMGSLAVILALIEWLGHLTPWPMLSLLFLIGAGLVVQQAAWKPFLQDMVPEDELVAAISFNALSNKLAQAIGPIVGGFLMVIGAAFVFAVRVLSHLVMILALRHVPKPAARSTEQRVAVTRSLRDGWRHLRKSPALYGPMIRSALLMAPVGGVLALLPLEARDNIQTGVIGYGGLLTALGIGTATGVSVMPLLQRHIRINVLTTVALVVFSATVLGISRWDSMLLDASFLLFFGFSWSILSVSHQYSVQTSAPERMRGLMTSFYNMTLQGAMALGSVVFGVIAEKQVVSVSILIAGLVATSGLLLVGRYPVSEDRALD
ncbi:MFS transporter [Mycolicibacterium sphagni]|uniref:MFS transporter n=1 Tax=Mycolicibacterium sphagni TaxID=1786 RepID=UPI0015761770